MSSRFPLSTIQVINVLRVIIAVIMILLFLVVLGILGQLYYVESEKGTVEAALSEPFILEEGQSAFLEDQNLTLYLEGVIYKPLAEDVRGVWSGKGAEIIIYRDGSMTTTSLSMERNTFGIQGTEIVLGNVTSESAGFTIYEK